MSREILVAVDFSPATEPVLAAATVLAKALAAPLHLLHVAPPEPDFVGWKVDTAVMRDVTAGELRREHRELQALGDRLAQEGLDVTAICVQGATVEKILALAERIDAAWIVLGSHARGPLARALLGSTSEGVLRRAACPVVVVPPSRDAGA